MNVLLEILKLHVEGSVEGHCRNDLQPSLQHAILKSLIIHSLHSLMNIRIETQLQVDFLEGIL